MARVVVVGGGLGGTATAARLAKLGHRVTLCEAGDRLGGALSSVEQDGFVWDGGAPSTLLPAVLRDLELALMPLDLWVWPIATAPICTDGPRRAFQVRRRLLLAKRGEIE